MSLTLPADIDSLPKIYTWLDTEITSLYSSHEFVSAFLALRNKFDTVSQNAINTQFEVEVLSCGIYKNQLGYHFSSVNSDGIEQKWPNHEIFSNDLIDYVISRAKLCKNSFLKAYYHHFLWLKKKEVTLAHISIDTYIDLIPKIAFDDEDHHADLTNVLLNCFYLAKAVKYKLDEIKRLTNKVLNEFSYSYDSFAAVRKEILLLMLEEKKIFKKNDFIGTSEICIKTANLLIEKNNIHFAVSFLHIGQQIDSKYTLQTTFAWYEEMGKCWEILIDQAKQYHNLAGATYCRDAIESYKKAGNDVKISELTETLKSFKTNISFAPIPIEIPEDYLDAVERDIADWMTRSCEEILMYLIQSDAIVPSINDMKSTEFFLASLFGSEIVDHAGNTIKHYSSDEEKEIRRLRQSFDINLELTMIFFDKLMYQAILNEKFTANCLLSFLNQHSWLGKQIKKPLTNGKYWQYTWLTQVAPAIHEYFIQMQYGILTNFDYQPNFILAMDSLAMKFEGMIRDFCDVLEINVLKTEMRNSRMTEEYKDINMLLREKELETFFGGAEALLLKIILIEKDGYNFRNKIGHGLMMPGEYSFRGFNLLLFALLRLAKYDFTKGDMNQ